MPESMTSINSKNLGTLEVPTDSIVHLENGFIRLDIEIRPPEFERLWAELFPHSFKKHQENRAAGKKVM